MDAAPEVEGWITVPEAASRSGVGVKAIRSMIHRRQLTYRRVGNGWPRVLASDVDSLVRASTVPAIGGER